MSNEKSPGLKPVEFRGRTRWRWTPFLLVFTLWLCGCSLEKYKTPTKTFSESVTLLTAEINRAANLSDQAYRDFQYRKLTLSAEQEGKEASEWEKRVKGGLLDTAPHPTNVNKWRELHPKSSYDEGSLKKLSIDRPVPEETRKDLAFALTQLALFGKTMSDLAGESASDKHFAAQLTSISSLLTNSGELLKSADVKLLSVNNPDGQTNVVQDLGVQFSALGKVFSEIAGLIARGKRKRAIIYGVENGVPALDKMVIPMAKLMADVTELERKQLVERRALLISSYLNLDPRPTPIPSDLRTELQELNERILELDDVDRAKRRQLIVDFHASINGLRTMAKKKSKDLSVCQVEALNEIYIPVHPAKRSEIKKASAK